MFRLEPSLDAALKAWLWYIEQGDVYNAEVCYVYAIRKHFGAHRRKE